MYKVYVVKQRRTGSETLTETRTNTPAFAAAEAAFWTLRSQAFDARHLLLMTRDGEKLNVHRFESQPGDEDYVAPGSPLKS